MKISELLTESATDVVARHYKEASERSEVYYNTDSVQYKHKNREYYKQYFEEWYEDETTPVFSVPTRPAQAKYDTTPTGKEQQSAGYRGLQYVKARAGLPYNRNVQAPIGNKSTALASQTQSAMPVSNGGGY